MPEIAPTCRHFTASIQLKFKLNQGHGHVSHIMHHAAKWSNHGGLCVKQCAICILLGITKNSQVDAIWGALQVQAL
jgi:hypothetical protein